MGQLKDAALTALSDYEAHMAAKRYPQAAGAATDLIATNPGDARFLTLRAEALIKARKLDAALADLTQAVSLAPDAPDPLVTLASVLFAKGDDASGEACLLRALQLDATHLMALLTLGRHFEKRGRATEAQTMFMRALVAHPDSAQACHLTARVLHFQGKREQAAALFAKAIQNDPTLPEPYRILAAYLREAGDLPSAIGMYNALLKQCPEDQISLAERAHCLGHICDWDAPGYRDFQPRSEAQLSSGAAPFLFLALDDDPAHQRVRSELYAKRIVGQIKPGKVARHRNDKIHVGYFSADFHDHATMHLMAGMLEAHDRDRFALFAFSYGPDIQDFMRARAVAAVDTFTDIQTLSDFDAAELARSQKLDIAVDLKGFTGGTRPGIFAHRAAPVQVGWLGYPGTTGASQMDYIIADSVVIPKNLEGAYSEKVLTLPGCYQPNDRSRPLPDPTITRSAAGLPEEGFVFCCFNGSYKISPAEFDIWMELLCDVPVSVLWLLECGEVAQANLRKAAAARGVDPERIVFAPKCQQTKHLARLGHADLFLDTFYCNAHTTASDALWAGVPVVTVPGRQFAARVAASLATSAGTPETVCETRQAYFEKARDLARDPGALQELKHRLVAGRATCRLFDTATFTREFEAALERAHKGK